MPLSIKFEIDGSVLDTTETIKIIFHSNLKIALITPGGVPGVLEEPVVQASGFIMAIADNEYSVVDGVYVLSFNFYLFHAIVCIYDTACIGMYGNIIGKNSGADRLLCYGCLNLGYVMWIAYVLDFDLNGLGGLV